MQYPQLMMLRMAAQGTSEAARQIEKSLHILSQQSFAYLAHWMLSAFVREPALELISVTTLYKPSIFADEKLIEIGHHCKLVAIGADLGLSDPAQYEDLLTELLPLEQLGEGSAELKADSPLVAEYVKALTDNDDDAAGVVEYKFSIVLLKEIGNLGIVHRLNSFL